VLDVKIRDFPTHAASLPVAIIPNCAATRHVHFVLDGSGPARFEAPRLEDWPDVHWAPAPDARRVDLARLTKQDVAGWKPGETLLLSGKLLTGRDAPQALADLLRTGHCARAWTSATVSYTTGPVDAVPVAVGPAGPYGDADGQVHETMLEHTGLLGMIVERGPEGIDAIKRHGGHLIAVGGAAYLVSKAIKSSRPWPRRSGHEGYEFEVQDMPVTVAVDAAGNSVHSTGPALWRAKIANIPVTLA
jgi:fumarate hydratase class I